MQALDRKKSGQQKVDLGQQVAAPRPMRELRVLAQKDPQQLTVTELRQVVAIETDERQRGKFVAVLVRKEEDAEVSASHPLESLRSIAYDKPEQLTTAELRTVVSQEPKGVRRKGLVTALVEKEREQKEEVAAVSRPLEELRTVANKRPDLLTLAELRMVATTEKDDDRRQQLVSVLVRKQREELDEQSLPDPMMSHSRSMDELRVIAYSAPEKLTAAELRKVVAAEGGRYQREQLVVLLARKEEDESVSRPLEELRSIAYESPEQLTTAELRVVRDAEENNSKRHSQFVTIVAQRERQEDQEKDSVIRSTSELRAAARVSPEQLAVAELRKVIVAEKDDVRRQQYVAVLASKERQAKDAEALVDIEDVDYVGRN